MSPSLSPLHSQFPCPETSVDSRGKFPWAAWPGSAACCCPPPATLDGQGLLLSSGQYNGKWFYSKHLPGGQEGCHIAKAAHHQGYHNTGESTTLKSPSMAILERRGTSLSPIKHVLRAVCWAYGKTGKTWKREKGLSGSFQCCRPSYSLPIPRGPIPVQEGGNLLPEPQAQALQEFLEANFSWDVIQICTLSLCPCPFLFLKGSKSKTQVFLQGISQLRGRQSWKKITIT